jgi:hypothetical protein
MLLQSLLEQQQELLLLKMCFASLLPLVQCPHQKFVQTSDIYSTADSTTSYYSDSDINSDMEMESVSELKKVIELQKNVIAMLKVQLDVQLQC